MNTEEIYSIVPDKYGWRKLPNGNFVRAEGNVRFGNNLSLGNYVSLGDGVKLGNDVSLGNNVMLGNYVTLGDGVRLGNHVTVGKCIKLGNRARIADGISSVQLNLMAIAEYAKVSDSHVFVKWVTPERKSPNFDGGTILEYPKGATVTADGDVSDQQCAAGLHVLRIGVRPEHVGMCFPDHDFVPLFVRVKSSDILHAGMPGNMDKLRVRELEVLT